MKTKLIYLLLLFALSSFSQEIPIIKVGKKTISIKKLKVKVSVVGDIAITTYDMEFYNPKNRILEGELSFPLGENQSVTRFALDINGNLREAVVVEKEKARVAFESTVRKRIDPALLEQTKGNNYKARIYPIPARGYKRVVVAFKQKLVLNNESYYYKLPFNFKNKLEEFSLSFDIFNQNNKPVFTKGMIKEFLYDSKNERYYARINKRKTSVIKPVLIKIPLNVNKEKVLVNENCFYFNKQLNIKERKVALKRDITIFWDISLSQKNKKRDTEIAFLNAYFNKVKNCKVNLVLFSTKIKSKKEYHVKNGNWALLKDKIETIIYDGASSFAFLKKYKDSSKLGLLFTDGLNTLSNSSISLNNKTHIINSLVSANHVILKNTATASGGKYINLQQISIMNAIDKISKKQLQFLGTNFSEEELEVYPKKGSVVTTNFSITGKGNYVNKKIKLYFGFGNDTIKTVSFFVKRNKIDIPIVTKIWAQKKLENLIINSTENKDEIIKLSKKHQIISPFTSMLILDRIEDYVTHNIEPPKELRNKYNELIAQKINNKKERLERLRKSLFDKYKDFFNWYNKDYTSIDIDKSNRLKKDLIVRNIQREVSEVIPDTIIDNNEFFISGIVADDSGALPGATITVKGTTNGVETDFDGKYKIKVKKTDVLTFSFVGMRTVEKVMNDNTNVNVLMENDNILDEIVVTAFGVAKEVRTLNAAVSVVNSENISSTLQKKVAGVKIRGASSVSASNPLFVVDGSVVSKNPNLKPNEIQSIYTLTKKQGESIYGSKVKNGIVVIVTKNGFDNDLKEIKGFENLIKEKIELKGWNPDTPYLKVLNKIKDNKLAYLKYIELREKYGKSPSFYVDVADFFKSRKAEELAIQILTNVAEIDLDNYELLKALAYKFEEYKLYKYAVYIYKEILKLRPEDIQSYRDLALVYEYVGKYQESVDLLYKIVNGELLEKDENRRFSGIEVIALNELNRMISLYNNQLTISHIDKSYINDTKTSIRVLIDWNHNDTDIDLWVTDPNGEKCYYSHKKTKIGGLMSNDMTQGFGPEQFVLKKTIKGSYKINVKYYASGQQKISGPTFLKITTFKNYGYKNEQKSTQLVRLVKADDVLDIGELIF
ncbi:VIT domain-containing protein [Tenacibaculum ovolyticum]|uniref:VIT domain-containing protein n=1 Tax=Tenacibaculum ovolyticum TaxID=104270 RepID=UPI001F2BB450|nr:VIT domain-containing protein [Tenacibaculum ovolyticum]